MSEEFGLHPVAVEDAIEDRERPKLDRYRTHHALITVRKDNRMNVITKKATGWAAIVAVPTFITGFYGMNVPYPGFDKALGFAVSFWS